MQLASLMIAPSTTAAPQTASQPARPGDPMVITAGNDVGLQVASPEEARKAFLERGELRRDTRGLVDQRTAHGPLYREHGVTTFEPYVKWMLLEPKEGE